MQLKLFFLNKTIGLNTVEQLVSVLSSVLCACCCEAPKAAAGKQRDDCQGKAVQLRSCLGTGALQPLEMTLRYLVRLA